MRISKLYSWCFEPSQPLRIISELSRADGKNHKVLELARAHTQIQTQAGRQTDRQRDRQTDRLADRQGGREAGRQAGRQTDRQTDRHLPYNTTRSENLIF